MYADRPTLVTKYIKDLLHDNRDVLSVNGNHADVYYGDQAKFPRTPTLCVESAPFDRALAGVGGKGRTDNIIRVNVIAYVGSLEGGQVTRLHCEELGETIMDVLHEDVTLGGRVTHGFVHTIVPGYSARPDGMMHAVRVGWQGQTKTNI